MSFANSDYKETLDGFGNYEEYLEEIEDIQDEIDWGKAKRKDTQQAYENYLYEYPNGIYSFEAKQKIDEFITIAREKELEKRRQEEIKRKKDEETWKAVCKSDTQEDYENYLKYYLDGMYSDEAKERINKLTRQSIEKDWKIACEKDTKESYDEYIILHDSNNNPYYNDAVELYKFLSNEITNLNYSNNRYFTFYIKNEKESSYTKNIGKYGLKNKNYDIIVPAKYDLIKIDKEGICVVNSNLHGLYDFNGRIILETKYDSFYGKYIKYINEYRFVVEINNKYGVKDNSGKTILDTKYDYIEINYMVLNDDEDFDNKQQCIYIEDKGKSALYDLEGTVLIDFKYEIFEKPPYSKYEDWLHIKYNDDLYVNIKNKKSLFYNKIACFKASPFEKAKFAIATENNKLGFADIDGTILIEPELDWWINGKDMLREIKYFASYFKKLWTIKYIRKNGKYGIIDNELDYILPPIYDKLYSGKEEISYGEYGDSLDDPMSELYSIDIVKYNNKYGLFKVHKGIVLHPHYDFIYKLDYHGNENYYIISNEGKEGICNRNGKIILDVKYKLYSENYELVHNIKNGNFTDLNEVVFMVKKDNKFGLFHVLYEQFILKPIYDKFNYYTPLTSDDYNDDIVIKIGNKKGLINSSGTWLKPLSIWNNFRTI